MDISGFLLEIVMTAQKFTEDILDQEEFLKFPW
jgi:hypothetical protein